LRRAQEPRKQKNDRRDALLLLRLLVEHRFPAIWMPPVEQRICGRYCAIASRHRHLWVRMQVRIQNALQAIALSHGLRRGTKLWNQTGQQSLRDLRLTPTERLDTDESRSAPALLEMCTLKNLIRVDHGRRR
jgi:transposase